VGVSEAGEDAVGVRVRRGEGEGERGDGGRMRYSFVAVLACMVLLVVGCAKNEVAPSARAADDAVILEPGQSLSAEQMAGDPRYPAIVHVVSRGHVVTVRSGPDELLYSMKDATGNTLVADASGPEFEQRHPDLYRAIRHYIAVEADDAPAVHADHDARVQDARGTND
jgi:hypothetical protein